MRPRKSLEEHELAGTRPHYDKADSKDDSKQFTGGRLKMPKDFSPEKAAIWKMLFGPLQRRKTLTKADSAGAVIIVEMWVRWKAVAALAEANPCTEVSWTDSSGTVHTKVVEHPASKMATQLESKLLRALAEFSATPASRERTRPTKQPAPKTAAPPPPNSYEGLALQLQKLREEQQAAEQSAEVVNEQNIEN